MLSLSGLSVNVHLAEVFKLQTSIDYFFYSIYFSASAPDIGQIHRLMKLVFVFNSFEFLIASTFLGLSSFLRLEMYHCAYDSQKLRVKEPMKQP